MVNSHYIPQFILRHFSDKESIQYCDMENGKLERRNIKTTFSEKGYYPNEIETDLCNKIESQFAKLLNDKILKEKYNIILSSDELFILKKYLIISIIRYNITEQLEKERNVSDEYIQAYSDKFYENINKVLNCNSFDDMMEHLNIDPFKYMRMGSLNKELGDIKLFVDIKNIIHSYIVFVKTNRCKEKFVVSDTGFAYQATHLSLYSNDKFDKCMYTLGLAQKTGNPDLFYISQLMSPYDYFICPVSEDMAIISLSIFFKSFDKSSELYNIISIDGLFIKDLIGFGDCDLIEAPKPELKYGRPISYNYKIKQLATSDLYHLNSKLINNALQFIGFKNLESVKPSIEYYIYLPESQRKFDLSFLIKGNEPKTIIKDDPLKIENISQLAYKIHELNVNSFFSSQFDAIIYKSVREEMFYVDNSMNSYIIEMAKENISSTGDTYANLESEIMRIIISEIVKKRNPQQYLNICYEILPSVMQVSKIFDIQDFKKDSYLKNIKIDSFEYEGVKLNYEEYAPHELFVYNVPCWFDTLGISVPRLGCFPEKCRYPVIKKGRTVLRSVAPDEIETLRIPIKRAQGKVLILGAGMGYYAYKVSQKKDVISVTIIESDKKIYNIFKEAILPQFEYKDKVRIILDDEINYLKRINDGKYNYCYSDICAGIDDIETYFKVKEIGKSFNKTIIDYWNEFSFADKIAKYVLPEIVNAISNYKESIYDETLIPDTELRIIKYVRKLLHGVIISSVDDLNYYIAPQNILKMIENTTIKF